MLASLSAEELVLVLGAYSALVMGAFGLLTKFVLDTRKQTSETVANVNNRPKGDPTLRDIVEQMADRLDRLDDSTSDRHDINSRRIERVAIAVDAQSRKMDRLGDAVGGINSRLDRLEGHNKGD